eukprot:1144598-Pelagomonas_calceolata.AAC.4
MDIDDVLTLQLFQEDSVIRILTEGSRGSTPTCVHQEERSKQVEIQATRILVRSHKCREDEN